MKTDFEKLVLARKYIEVLKQENELLKKEIETKHREVKAAERAVQEEKDRKEKMTPEEKKEIKSGLYVQQMRETIANLKAKLKAANDENKKLLEQVIKMKSDNPS